MRKCTVVYSFNGRWEEPLRTGKVQVFFRKRRPVSVPKYVAFYVGVPTKAIIGYAHVKGVDLVDFQQAAAIKEGGHIDEKELWAYIGKNGKVHALHVGKPFLLEKALKLEELTSEYEFNPPQSFSYPSEKLEKAILRSAE